MSGARLGARGLDHLKDNLSGRDLAIIGQVAELRLMSGKQIQRIHFTLDDHASPDTAARSARRVLERLVDERILHRLERRVGGVRAGSASFVYSLGPVGQRLLDLRQPRHRFAEPSTTFAVHTLAIVDTVVELTEAARHRQLELLSLQAEPRCWRMLPSMTGNGIQKGEYSPNGTRCHLS